MKRVIRKGVFETNSSSTHSFTLKKMEDKTKDNCSFELVSSLAKTVWLMGVIDNANKEYSEAYSRITNKDLKSEYRKRIINTILELDSQTLDEITKEYGDIKKAKVFTLINIMQDYLPYEDITLYFPYYGDLGFVVNQISYQERLLKYKEIVLETYCELENLTKEEALEKIYYEAYKNRYLLKLTENPKALKEYLEDSARYDFKEAYEKSEEKDLVKFTLNYIKEDVEKSIIEHNKKIDCSVYFLEGSLDECECGFNNFFNIAHSLDLQDIYTEEEMKEHAIKFLKENKIVGKEYYCATYLEGNGEQY